MKKEELTENQKAIQVMMKDIEQSEKEIRAKKLMLNQMKKVEKKPFIESRMARAYLHTVNFITRPLAKMNNRASKALKDPVGYRRAGMLDEAQAILTECKEHEKTEGKKDKNLSVKAAAMVMELTQEAARGQEWKNIDSTIQALRDEVTRLRPSSSSAEKDMKTLFEQDNPNPEGAPA